MRFFAAIVVLYVVMAWTWPELLLVSLFVSVAIVLAAGLISLSGQFHLWNDRRRERSGR